MSLVRRGGSVFDPFSTDLWTDLFDNIMFRSVVPSSFSSGDETAAFAAARVDWKETPEAHVFKADLPGVKKEEVKVEVEEDGGVLVISGQRSREEEDKEGDRWRRVERSSGRFERRFRLPEGAMVDQVKAGLENGVLTVTVPKAEGKKADVKAIEISG